MNEAEILRRHQAASDLLFEIAAERVREHGPEDEHAEQCAKTARDLDETTDQIKLLYKRARRLVAA